MINIKQLLIQTRERKLVTKLMFTYFSQNWSNLMSQFLDAWLIRSRQIVTYKSNPIFATAASKFLKDPPTSRIFPTKCVKDTPLKNFSRNI